MLLDNLLTDQEVWRHQEESFAWTYDQIVSSSLDLDCGPMALEFFNAEDGLSLDSSIFVEDRTQSNLNLLTVTKA